MEEQKIEEERKWKGKLEDDKKQIQKIEAARIELSKLVLVNKLPNINLESFKSELEGKLDAEKDNINIQYEKNLKIWKARLQKIKEIQEEFKKSKNKIEQEHKMKLDLFSQEKEDVIDDLNIGEDIQGLLNEELRKVKDGIFEEEEKFKEDLLLKNKKEIEEYAKEAEKHTTEPEAKISQDNLEDEIAKIQENTEEIKEEIEKKFGELKALKKNAKDSEVDLTKLFNNQEEDIEKVKHKRKSSEKEALITALEQSKKQKDCQIRNLEKMIGEYQNVSIQQKANEEPTENLEKIAKSIDEIKSMISQRGIPSKSLVHEEISKPKLDDSEIKGIYNYLRKEKDELKTTKKKLIKDYKITSELHKTIENNRIEWKQEMYRSKLSNSRKKVLQEMKNNVETQARTIAKQINNITYSYILLI